MGTMQGFGGTRAAGESDTDTIELELRQEELRALTAAAAPTALASFDLDSSRPPRRDLTKKRWGFGAPIALLVCAGAVLFAFQRGRVTAPHGPSVASAVVEGHIDRVLPAAPAGPPVRFANPFDRGEIFEFAPGTSDADARDAVAKVLTARAQDRLALLKTKRARRNPPMSPHTAAAQTATRLSMESDFLARSQ